MGSGVAPAGSGAAGTAAATGSGCDVAARDIASSKGRSSTTGS
ncbi:MAG: hypothetical protein JW384_01716 [Nitrosomonadaceae bacterium]|nr:hypothetical protein [Nitrosomonadaceae bacterium]